MLTVGGPLGEELGWRGFALPRLQAVRPLFAFLLIWTFRTLGKNLTDTVVTRKVHTLVTAGPYRWVRHPFYDCVAIVALAIGLAAANWFLFITTSLIFFLLAVRTRIEEEKLIERFGDEYRRYMERTGRFFPRFRDGN